MATRQATNTPVGLFSGDLDTFLRCFSCCDSLTGQTDVSWKNKSLMERYESLGPVGEGSYGTVTKCRHRDSGRLVAIKKFVDSDDDKTVKKIALREINLLRQLRHDNLVNLLEVWRRRRRWYLVFEFVDRTLLDDLEQNPNGLDLNTCRQYLFQILRAADFCHQQNVIHRDIKPENILISQGGVVKLCDFGFARTIASPSEGGVYTDYVATRWYRAPELLVGDIKYGKPVDIWALGCLLIEMLTGQPLFPGDSDLDQIYHIVRCFGNLTTHHQELFYRNPVFSGVKLPECSSRVPLPQRFPAVSPTGLDLAQRCLEMDPEGRAQCLDLLEHPLFKQDSFHVRFLEDLNAKIQKEHRENSTLPKITKTPGQEKEKGDEKNSRGKDTEEKLNKEKTEKTKGKAALKLFKHVHNPTESLMSKHKTCGNKNIQNPAQNSIKIRPERSTRAELKESEISKSNKSLTSRSAGETNTTPSPKKKNSVVVKPKHERILTPEPRKDHLQSVEDLNYNGPDNEKNMMKNTGFSKSEPNPEFTKNWSKPNVKEPKLPKNPKSDHQSLESSAKTESDFSLAPKSSQLSSNDTEVSAALMISGTKSCKLGTVSELHTIRQETEQRTSESPKVLSKNQKAFQTTSNNGTATSTNISTSSPKTLPVDLTEPVLTEPSPAHKTAGPPKGVSNPKVSKPGSSSKTQSKDKELSEDKAMKRCHGYLKMKTVTETPGGLVLFPQASAGDPEPSEPSSNARKTTRITAEGRCSLTPGMYKKLSPVLKVSEKENQENGASLPFSISSTIYPLTIQTSKASGSSSNNTRNNINESHSLKVPHTKQKPSKTGSFSDHVTSAETPKTQNILMTPGSRNKSDTQDTTNIRDLTLTVSVDHKASSRDLPLHIMVSTDPNDLDFNVPRTSTSSPPVQPCSSAVLLPQSSQTLIPSLSVFSSSSPAASDLIQGAGVHAGTASLRCVEKPKVYGGTRDRQAQQFAAGSLTWQASENSQASKNKSHVHFPDVRSSVLELRGKEGKHNKSLIKNLRRDKHPASSSPPPDVRPQGQNRDTNKQ